MVQNVILINYTVFHQPNLRFLLPRLHKLLLLYRAAYLSAKVPRICYRSHNSTFHDHPVNLLQSYLRIYLQLCSERCRIPLFDHQHNSPQIFNFRHIFESHYRFFYDLRTILHKHCHRSLLNVLFRASTHASSNLHKHPRSSKHIYHDLK